MKKVDICYFTAEGDQKIVVVTPKNFRVSVENPLGTPNCYHCIRADVTERIVFVTPYEKRYSSSDRRSSMFLGLDRVGGDRNSRDIPHGCVGGVYIEDRKLEIWSRPGELPTDLVAMVSLFL